MNIRTCIVALAVASLAIAGAAEAARPRVEETADAIVLSNDALTVKFLDKSPRLAVFPAGAVGDAAADVLLEDAAFEYELVRVVEYRDLDSNGAPDANEIVGTLPLSATEGWVATLSDDETGATVTLDLTAPATLPGPLGEAPVPDREATVRLVFRLFGETQEIESGDAKLLVLPNAVKYDFVVEKWPWIDATGNRLALETRVTGALEHEEADADRAGIVEGDVEIGSIAWTNTATGADANGEDVEVPVIAAITPEAPTEDRDAEKPLANATRVTFTYDAPGLATLAHDPTISLAAPPATEEQATGAVADRLKDVPAPGALLAVGAIAAAVLVARRR